MHRPAPAFNKNVNGWHRFIFPALIFCTVVALVIGGLQLRHWTWNRTGHVRYQHDIVNGFYWGNRTIKEGERVTGQEISAGGIQSWKIFFAGYFSLYDRVKSQAYKSDYQLDYAPLRLLVMSLWVKHVRQLHPDAVEGRASYVEPLLHFNLFCEALAAIGMFLLVRLWILRDRGDPPWLLRRIPPNHRGWVGGLLAATFLWLNPSLVLDAHGWPQWDVWILPCFVFAAWFASLGRWFWCGCLLAVGGMLKGQLLFVAPFFVFWPLCLRDWKGSLRLLLGFLVTFAIVTLPWLVRGDFSWLQIGFLYGTQRYPYLFISSCYNLPALLARSGWDLKDALLTLHFGQGSLAFTLQWVLRLIYLGSLAGCAWCTARYARRNDVRVLLALAAPWLLMFGLLGQMHERYLLWGAAITAVALGVSLRATLLHLAFTILSTMMIAHVMLVDKKLPSTLSFINFLDAKRAVGAWIFLVCLGIYLWVMAGGARVVQLRRSRSVPKAVFSDAPVPRKVEPSAVLDQV